MVTQRYTDGQKKNNSFLCKFVQSLFSLISMINQLDKLLKLIEKQLGWGSSLDWQSKDFEQLGELVFEKTKISLSPSTLKRIWGRVEYHHLPSMTTLDTLAKFAGFENWRTFNINDPEKEIDHAPAEVITAKSANRYKINIKAAGFITALLVIGLLNFYTFRKTIPVLHHVQYKFSSRKLTRNIPNTVIFDYDASEAPGDSVSIQQSWDPRTESRVSKNGHQHTSVYYEPGFYKAKLVVNHQVVKEHSLMIPTNGWLGLIENKPIPVYLENKDFVTDTLMHLPARLISSKNIPLGPQPPVIQFFNVGNFKPVSIKGFSFSCSVKNEYHAGAAACAFAEVFLITDAAPIKIPLGIKGCASELDLISVDKYVSGKTADLSGFGTDMLQWVSLSCKNNGDKISYYVNGKLAYECPLPKNQVHIVGMSFAFLGTGAVKNIRLAEKDKIVYKCY